MSQFTVDVVNWMQGTFAEESGRFFDFFSTWGGPVGWPFVVSLVFWLGGSTLGLRVGFATSIASITNPPLKWVVAQPRPYYVTDAIEALRASDGLGMPSGHAQGVAGQWGAIGYWVRRWWALTLAALFVACTGAARVYYGVHSPLQVVVGWGMGLLTVIGVVRLERPVVAWWRSRSSLAQVAGAMLAAALIAAIALGISLGLRRDFQPPPEWQMRWHATHERLVLAGEDPANDSFTVINPASSVTLASNFLGYVLCGLWVLRLGETRPSTALHGWANVAIGAPLVVLLLLGSGLLEELSNEVVSGALVGLTLPSLAGVVVPRLAAHLIPAH